MKELSKAERLQVIGLFTLGMKLNQQLDDIGDAIAELVGAAKDGGYLNGRVSDVPL